MDLKRKSVNQLNYKNYIDLLRTKTNISCYSLVLDFSDPETQIATLGMTLGIVFGVGAPIFYARQDELDEKRLEEIRSLNRATKEATGEFMSDEEIYAIRPPRWTDRREFVDND